LPTKRGKVGNILYFNLRLRIVILLLEKLLNNVINWECGFKRAINKY
jgi:hypothetical protein